METRWWRPWNQWWLPAGLALQISSWGLHGDAKLYVQIACAVCTVLAGAYVVARIVARRRRTR